MNAAQNLVIDNRSRTAAWLSLSAVIVLLTRFVRGGAGKVMLGKKPQVFRTNRDSLRYKMSAIVCQMDGLEKPQHDQAASISPRRISQMLERALPKRGAEVL